MLYKFKVYNFNYNDSEYIEQIVLSDKRDTLAYIDKRLDEEITRNYIYYIEEGYVIIINQVGGYFWIKPEDLENLTFIKETTYNNFLKPLSIPHELEFGINNVSKLLTGLKYNNF